MPCIALPDGSAIRPQAAEQLARRGRRRAVGNADSGSKE